MEQQLNEEHLQIHRKIHAFTQSNLTSSAQGLDRQRVMHRDLLPAMASTGLLAISIPPQYGGAGGDAISLALAAEELEEFDTAPRVVLTAHTAMCGLSVLRWGNEAQKERFLTPQSSGERIGTAALHIPDEETAGFSTPFIARREKIDQDHNYMLDGSLSDVQLAAVADHFLVIARILDTDRLAAFVVERESAGVLAGDNYVGDILPLHGPLTLHAVHVPESRRLGAEGDGAAIGEFAVNAGRFTTTAGAIGLVKRCVNHSLACIDRQKCKNDNYARFSPMIAGMFRRIDMARRMLHEAIKSEGIDAEMSRALSLAHWVASTAAYDSLADATQIESVCACSAAPAGVH